MAAREFLGYSLAPHLYPGSALALRSLREALPDFEGKGLVLSEAWMLFCLPEERVRLLEMSRDGRLAVERDYVSVDPKAPLYFREGNRELARQAAAPFDGIHCYEDASAAMPWSEAFADRAGLCLEACYRADLLAWCLARCEGYSEEVLRDVLMALSPAGIGGTGRPETERRALAVLGDLLEDYERSEGAELWAGRFVLPPAKPLPRKVPAKTLEGGRLSVMWSRGKGLSWTPPGLRSSPGLFTLEVQGETISPQQGKEIWERDHAFTAAHPERPRLFEVAHMKPVLHAVKPEGSYLSFERELKLPSRPDGQDCRLVPVNWHLDLLVHADEPTVDLRMTLEGLPPGQRVRLRVPVPFHPRPTGFDRMQRDGGLLETQLEGPFGLQAIQGGVRLHRQEAGETPSDLYVEGPGMREIELLSFKNEHVLAITLTRSRRQDPPLLRREFRLSW